MSQDRLRKVKDALISIEGLPVYHYWRAVKSTPFCVWYEDTHDTFDADNKHAEHGWVGYVDFFTKTEFDSFIDSIEEALTNTEGLTWRLNDVQFEEETFLIHYSWQWVLV